jgi:lysophospholipase L1-like esterase
VRRFLPTLADRVLARGIAGDGVGLLPGGGRKRRLAESIIDPRPSHVVLLLGVNDLGLGLGVTLPPARGRFAALNPHIVAFNTELRRIAREGGCPLIDLYPLVADDRGELPADRTDDGIHWTDPVYERFGREIERAVAAATGPRP